MSSRQRSRLANQALLSSLTAAVESEEEEEEVEEENTANQLKRTFALYSSSSEHDSSANESEGSVHTGQIKNHKVQAASTDNAHPSQLMTTLDELAYLDTVIEQNTQDITQTEKSPAALVTDVYSSLFRIENARNLDVTAALRRRQGEPVFPDDNDHQLAGRRGNNANRMAVRGGAGRAQQLGGIINRPLNSKRYVFGAPSEDWTRPPAFMAGGIGMSKVATKHRHRQQYANARLNMNGNDKYYTSSDNVCEWYAFDWSGEFRFLHDQYQYIEDTGDANLLVMFLTHFPHHTPGLLQLSMVYARMQQLDKAADLVRRALYVLECAALESFKPPAVAAATVPENMKMRGAMRMDPYVVENGAYFAVLYRHMQICSMQGHHSVAVDVCRYLLSLHPADDAQHLLLTLDYYLIRAENHALLLAFCGLTPQSLCDKVSASAADDSSAGVCQFVWSSPYQFDLFSPVPVPVVEQNEKVSTGAKEGVARAADSDKRKDGNSTAAHSNAHNSHSNSMSVGLDTHGSRALQHLPNWWFSLALSRWIVEQQPQQQQQQQPQTLGAATGTGRMRAGTYLLKAALFRWPFMLAPLLRKIGVDTTAAWRPILTHEWFKNAEKRVPEDGYLQHIGWVYATRNAALWTHHHQQQQQQPQALEWLKASCTELLGELDFPSMATSSVPGPANAPQQCSSLQEVLQAQVSQYLALHDPSNPHNYALICYEDAAEEEFADAFPPFPSSVQLPVIDATLDDPVYLLSGAVKFRDFMDSDGRFMFPVPAPYKSTLKDPAGGAGSGAGAGMDGYGYSSDSNSGGGEGSADERAPPRAHRGVRNGHNLLQLANMRFGAGADTGAATNFSKKDTRAANIDFNLPLMQLFLATLFPWIFVRPLPRATHRQQ